MHDVADFGLQFAVFIEIIVADLHGFIPGDGPSPTGSVAVLNKTSVGSYRAHGDHVGENRQPDRGDAAIDHFADRLRGDRCHLPAAYVTRPTSDRRDAFFFRPAIDVVLHGLGGFYRVVAGDALEE